MGETVSEKEDLGDTLVDVPWTHISVLTTGALADVLQGKRPGLEKYPPL